MSVLGISALYHDAAAAIVDEGGIIGAVQEERFSRIKNDRNWPDHSIQYCLSLIDKNPEYVAFYEDPALTFDRVIKNIGLTPSLEGSSFNRVAIANQLSNKSQIYALLKGLVREENNRFFIRHHISHASSTYFPSAFEKAAVLTVDAVGEWATTSIALGEGNNLSILREISYPHSLGLLYSALTYFCGFKVNSGEYKLMGLAPFGEPKYCQLIFDHLIQVNEDGSFLLNLENFEFYKNLNIIGERFDRVFNMTRRKPESRITQKVADIAASGQKVLEHIMIKLATHALEICETDHLCLAGGVALNCVANARVKQATNAKKIWIQPAAGDAGGALGAALYVQNAIIGSKGPKGVGSKDRQKGSFLGPSYSTQRIVKMLETREIEFQIMESREQHHREIAECLQKGMIVGRFFGRMEFGPRALGARSILADPRKTNGQRHVNLSIKFRESWRPFAPAILKDHASKWFHFEGESPFMLFTADLKDVHYDDDLQTHKDEEDFMKRLELQNKNCKLPAVVHVDRSARLQTVDIHRNKDFHDLLTAFYNLTDCPVLMNTSFNIRGEPIVCTPENAVDCFLKTDMDVLSIEDIIIYKQNK